MERSFYYQCLRQGMGEINFILNESGDKNAYHFVDLNRFYLINILKSGVSNYSPSKKHIIFSERGLMPLAFFYFKNISSVVSVFESGMKIKDISQWLLETRGLKTPPPSLKGVRCLSHSEIYIMRKVMTGESISSLASSLDVSDKTIYSRKLIIAGKLGIRRLEDLLIEISPRRFNPLASV